MGFGQGFVAVEPAKVVMSGTETQATAWGNQDTETPSPGTSLSAWGNEDTAVQVPATVEVA